MMKGVHLTPEGAVLCGAPGHSGQALPGADLGLAECLAEQPFDVKCLPAEKAAEWLFAQSFLPGLPSSLFSC